MERSADKAGAFVTTRWTRVLQARGESVDAAVALSELCGAYYGPVFAFVRCSTSNEEAARDLTQEFFARLLEGNRLETVDPARGRFRSYLLAAVKNFLRDAHAREIAAKRNPGIQSGTTACSGSIDVADVHAPNPEREFDRKWALAVLERALTALRLEQEESGKLDQFEELKPWLTGDSETLPRSVAAEKLGLSLGAIKVAIHRLRRRFRELTKAEIAATLHEPTPARISEELQYLVEIVS